VDLEGVRGHDGHIAIHSNYQACYSSPQRRLRCRRSSVTHAAQASGRENEPAIGNVSGFTEGRSTVQQLLLISSTERLHSR